MRTLAWAEVFDEVLPSLVGSSREAGEDFPRSVLLPRDSFRAITENGVMMHPDTVPPFFQLIVIARFRARTTYPNVMFVHDPQVLVQRLAFEQRHDPPNRLQLGGPVLPDEA